MSQILDDIRNVFRRKDDALTPIIVINVGVFLLLGFIHVCLFLFHIDPDESKYFYNMVMRQLQLSSSLSTFAVHPWTILTYFITQEGVFHLLSNLLFLYWFGQLLQEYLGKARLLSVYVLGGIAGGLFYLLTYNTLPAFETHVGTPLIGASGAVFAVVVAAATLLPNYTFSLLFIGSVRIVYIAGAYVLFSFLQISSNNPGGNIAHLGGALMGYLFIGQLRQGRDLGKPITATLDWIKGLFSKRSDMRVSYNRTRSFEPVASTGRVAKASQTQAQQAATTLQEEVDAILDKILASGYNSLTLEEKRKLDSSGDRRGEE